MSTDSAHRLPHGEIMVVEDDRSSLIFLSDILTEAGYHVRPASDGELGLRSVQAKQADLILLDFKLPGMNGVEVCRRLKGDPGTRDIPVIFISALGDNELKVRALDAGAIDYVTKPIDASEVLARIRTHLAVCRIQRRVVAQSEELTAEIERRKRTEEELEKHREHLEELVQERTAELRQEIAERKQAEEAVRDSERRYHRLVETLQEGIWTIDTDARTTFVNERMAEILGYHTDEMLGQPLFSFMDDQNVEHSKHLLERRRTGVAEQHDFTLTRKDGSRLEALIQTAPLLDENGSFVGAIAGVVDITQRKRNEEELRKFRAISDQAVYGAAISDLEGNLTYVNAKFAEMHGGRPEDYVGRSLSVFHDAEQTSGVNALNERLREEGSFVGEEVWHCRRDGTVFPCLMSASVVTDDGGAPMFLSATAIDITERMRAEAELRTAHDRLEAIWGTASLVDANLKEISDHILATVTRMTDSQFGFYGIMDEDESVMTIRSWSGDAMRDCTIVDKPGRIRISEADVWGEAIRRREPFILNDYRAPHAARKGLPEGHVPLKSLLVVPHFVDGRITTVAAVANREADYTQDDVSQIAALLNGTQAIVDKTEAQEKLREGQRRFRALVESAPIAIYETDAQGRCVYVNENWRKLTGLTLEEALGDGWRKGLHTDDRARVLQMWHEHAQDQEPWDMEFRCCTPDQETAWVVGRVVALRDTNDRVTGYLGANADITRRKRAEEALRESEERFRSLFENAPLGYQSLDANGDFMEVNETWCKVLGYPKEEVIGRSFSEFIHPDFHEYFKKNFPRFKSVGYILGVEFEMTKKDGSEIIVAFDGKIAHEDDGSFRRTHCVLQDITERKRAEEERSRLMSAIEQAAETVVITDAKGSIQYANPAFERVTGYSREEWFGRNPRLLKSGAQDGAFYEAMWDTLARGDTWKGRLVNKRKDGTLFEEDAVISPVRDSTGKIVNYVAVKRDVTEEVRLTEQLHQAQKMEAVGQLASGVAHDISNLVTVILNCTDRLGAGETTRDVQAAASVIEQAAQAARDVTRSLLTFGRVLPPEKQRVDLGGVVEQTVRMLRRMLPATIDLSVENPVGGPVWVNADWTQLQQVVLNLAINARDAMPAGGTLRISVTRGEEAGAARLAVADTGIGMSPEIRSRVFEPFFTTKTREQGTGLGLSVLHGIVKTHGGDVSVESAPGKGSTFIITLPFIEPEGAGEVATAESAPERGNGERILLAEDNDHLRGLLALSLQSLGYEVDSVGDGLAALDRFEKDGERIRLLLLGADLPGQGGLDTLHHVRSQGAGVPAVVITGDVGMELGPLADSSTRLLRKPFCTPDLARMVAEALAAGSSGEV